MANQQEQVTVTGFVAGDPTLRRNRGFRVLTFRMGSTRSRLNPTTRQWEDYGTAWVGRQSVPCFGRERRQVRFAAVTASLWSAHSSPSSGPMSKANRAVEPFSKPPTLGMT